jgi:hypothetical protein
MTTVRTSTRGAYRSSERGLEVRKPYGSEAKTIRPVAVWMTLRTSTAV